MRIHDGCHFSLRAAIAYPATLSPDRLSRSRTCPGSARWGCRPRLQAIVAGNKLPSMSEPDQLINEPFQPYAAEHALTESYLAAYTAVASGDLESAERLFSLEPQNSSCYGLALGYRALTLFRLGRLGQAEQVVILALGELKRVGSPHYPSAIQFMRTHGDVLLQQGRPTEAVPRYEETIRIAEMIAQQVPNNADAIDREVAHTRNSLGVALSRLGRGDDAVREFTAARDTYRKYPGQAWSGMSETLTNLAEACLSKTDPDPGRAEAALAESLDVAKAEGNADQLWRTRMKLIQLRSKLIPAEERDAIFDAGAADAMRQGRWGIAYLRRCIQAQIASEDGRSDDGLRAVDEAHSLEHQLDATDPHPAQLRLTHARLLWQAKAPADQVLRVLIQGAFLWFERLGRPLVQEDFRQTAAATHDHFRLLARRLLDAGRHEEALAAFEAGRTLAYAGEVDPRFPARLFTASANPFDQHGSTVHASLLDGIRLWLGGGVVIVPTVLPPEFVAFVLSSDGVSVARSVYPDPAAAAGERRAAESLFRSIVDIPHLLERAETAHGDAVPAPLWELVRQVRSLVGHRPVRMIAPHADLHKVPWRALLRESGVRWRQLPCATEFSLLLRGNAGSPGPVTAETAVGLGHGDALGTDFRDEARAFLRPFGPSGNFINTCTAQDVRRALSGAQHAAIISAHGAMKTTSLRARAEFALELQSGEGNTVDAFVGEFLPDAVRTRVVNLSACSSGVYEMGWGDYPTGVGPLLLLRGARYCVVCRFPVRATFALEFSELLAVPLAKGIDVPQAFAEALEEAEAKGWEHWRDLACIELLGRP
jgi:tetratricopeptide (TPR) repeat protein